MSSHNKYHVATFLITVCTYGDIHLVNGSNIYEGRVEVCANDRWGTVCNDDWDTSDAEVVCRQLGYNLTSDAVSSAYFGQGTGPPLLNSILCTGMENRLVNDCTITWELLSNTSCRHAGVQCLIFTQKLVSEIDTILSSFDILQHDTVTLGPADLQSSVNLTCTLTIYGSFEWQWLYNGDMIITNHTNVLVGDDTRASILTINQLRSTDAGNYTCGARYLASNNVFFYRYIDLQLTGIISM